MLNILKICAIQKEFLNLLPISFFILLRFFIQVIF